MPGYKKSGNKLHKEELLRQALKNKTKNVRQKLIARQPPNDGLVVSGWILKKNHRSGWPFIEPGREEKYTRNHSTRDLRVLVWGRPEPYTAKDDLN